MSKPIRHIAVMRLSSMGDVAMIVPVLRLFVYQNPTIKLTVISRPFFKPFFDGIENVTFFNFDEKNRHKGFLGLFKLYLDLKNFNIDAFADLHNVLRSKIVRNLFALNGKTVAFTDKGRAEKKALTRSENKIFKQLPTVFERHINVFKKLGFQVDYKTETAKNLFPQKAVLSQNILDLIEEKNADFQNKLIGIAPFAQYQEKIYPLDLMQKVIEELAKNKNYKILLFGGGNKEIEVLNSFAESKDNVIAVAGTIKFQEELQLISNLDIMLSMDSGNAHIAAMSGVKVITLWGATHPFLGFLPFNQPFENALVSDRNLYPKLPTSVYGNKIVDGYADVMRTISVDKIVSKIKSQLSN